MLNLDHGLKEFATKRQWEVLTAWEEHGSSRKASEVLQIDKACFSRVWKAVLKKAAAQGYSPKHDLTHVVPDGFKLRGASTLYDGDGNMKLQWVKSQIDQEKQRQIFEEAIQAMADPIPRLDPKTVPAAVGANEDLMVCYPVGDHHLGMLVWGEETRGDDYDLKIGERLLRDASAYLINASPISKQAAVIFLGDFMHYDSFESVTPTSRNQLDADSRFPKMVRAAIRSMRWMIEEAARHHEHVRVIVEIGNHDLSSSIFLMECLKNVYEDCPNIEIDNHPGHYHYFDFGKCLVGTHHGHGRKLQDLPLIMATDQPKVWGRTKHRYIWTGHVHHDQAKDYHGCKVESFRILAPADAWAAQKGYRPEAGMKSIVLHREYGEVARFTVNPEILK